MNINRPFALCQKVFVFKVLGFVNYSDPKLHGCLCTSVCRHTTKVKLCAGQLNRLLWETQKACHTTARYTGKLGLAPHAVHEL